VNLADILARQSDEDIRDITSLRKDRYLSIVRQLADEEEKAHRGRPHEYPTGDRVLWVVLHRRLNISQAEICRMYGINAERRGIVSQAIVKTERLLVVCLAGVERQKFREGFDGGLIRSVGEFENSYPEYPFLSAHRTVSDRDTRPRGPKPAIAPPDLSKLQTYALNRILDKHHNRDSKRANIVLARSRGKSITEVAAMVNRTAVCVRIWLKRWELFRDVFVEASKDIEKDWHQRHGREIMTELVCGCLKIPMQSVLPNPSYRSREEEPPLFWSLPSYSDGIRFPELVAEYRGPSDNSEPFDDLSEHS
jgi:hypothetical protein